LGFQPTDRIHRFGPIHFGPKSSDSRCSCLIKQLFAHHSLMPGELPADQLARDLQRGSGLFGQCLSTSQPGIRRANRPGRGEHSTVALQHDEGCVLVCQPAESGQRNHSVGADHDETAKAVSDAWQASVAAVGTDAVVNCQVTSIDVNFNAIAR
jgi:hypothetical protein